MYTNRNLILDGTSPSIKRPQNILDGTSPSIKRRHPVTAKDTVVNSNLGVQTNISYDNLHSQFIQSSDPNHWYQNCDLFTDLTPCSIPLSDIFKDMGDQSNCTVSPCNTSRCKTCKIIIPDNSFKSCLTNKEYHTHGFGNLNCKTSNVIYGIECTLCGLVYVGETSSPLHKRINAHRSLINRGGNQILYNHFNQPDHSVLSMKVRILEKIYHLNDDNGLRYRRSRELHWIKELGTAAPYGCNDNIKGVGNLSSPACSSVNVMSLFNEFPRRKRSHGHRHYKSSHTDINFHELLSYIHEPLGIHHIRTELYAISNVKLRKLQNECLDSAFTNQFSSEYQLSSIILDIAHKRLDKPPQNLENKNRSFLKLKFANKGINSINIGSILHHKTVCSKIPPYFKDCQTPTISYTYTRSIAPEIFNYKQALKDINTYDLTKNPPSCSCNSSPFLYSPVGHVITGDLKVISNITLRNIISKGPKYREPQAFTWGQNFRLVMDSVEEHARLWAKREKVEVDTLSEWVKAIRNLVKRRLYVLSKSISTKPRSVFKNNNVKECLSKLHNDYVVVPADKAANNVVFICKAYYYDCLIKELGINGVSSSSAYQHTTFTKEEIIQNHKSVLGKFNIHFKDTELDLPALYWIPKLHKCPYKQRYIAGSSKCSTKALSKTLTQILTVIKDGLQNYCENAYSHSGVNQMWILKNSKELLEKLQSHSLLAISSIKTYDFSTLYTTIPHTKLKNRLKDLIHSCFFSKKTGKQRYKYIVINHMSSYFVKNHSDASHKYSEEDIIDMLNFLIDNIYVEFGGQVFQQVVGIPMGTNCAPLLADLFLYSYEADFIQNLIRSGSKNSAKSFNFTFRYIDDVLSLNNHKFGEYLDFIYPEELEIKDTTETPTHASYLDLSLYIDHKKCLTTSLYDKRDDFDFQIVNFPFLCSNIPESPAYGVYISQLIRYARACSYYNDFLARGKILTNKLLKQGYTKSKLLRAFGKFYGRHYSLVDKYDMSLSIICSDLEIV